jgi:serine/threonine-protein kinase
MVPPCPLCGYIHNPATAPACLQCGSPLPGLGTGQLPPQAVLNGRYAIVRRVGQGGMGAVYQVADLRFSGKTWALKELSDAALGSPAERAQAVAAFQQEANLLAMLRHPNLPQVSDYFTERGRHYLVMDFVEGETLERRLQRQGRLPEPQVLDVAAQLSDVLGYLHGHTPPLIFRDLKPANVMITPAGQVKLIDFGIARLFKPGQHSDTVVIGTHGYAPPEQYGRGQTDARSDVYSLGVLLHQLLTGHDPAATPFQLPPACHLNPAVSPHVDAALQRATAHDPAARFPSAAALDQALRAPALPPAAVQAWPTPAAAPPAAPPLAPARRWRAAAAAVAAVALLAAVGWGGWALSQRGHPTPVPPRVSAAATTLASAVPVQPTGSPSPPVPTSTAAAAPTVAGVTDTPASSAPTWAQDQAAIEAVIQRYVELKARASGSWQTDGLEEVLQGEALQTQIESVRWLRDNNSRWEYELHSMAFDAFDRQDADHVRATVTKVETGRYYHQGSTIPSTRQSYYERRYQIWYDIQRMGGQWFIWNIDL